MAIKGDPAAWTAKFQRRIGQAGTDYQQGVQRAQGWAAKAQAAKARRDAGLQRAIASDAINAGIARAGDAKWQGNTLAKVSNWTGSAARAAAGYAAAAGKLQSYLNAGQQAIASMPTDSVAARLERARVHALALHNAAQSAKGQPTA